jgi:hypothetical protein
MCALLRAQLRPFSPIADLIRGQAPRRFSSIKVIIAPGSLDGAFLICIDVDTTTEDGYTYPNRDKITKKGLKSRNRFTERYLKK